jgi:carbohydrate-selective porin OprB
MKVFGIRENDTLGLGYAFVDLYTDNMGKGVQNSRFKNAFEHTGEVYYKYAINDALSIIPSFQIISNALGVQANGLTYVVGLRTSFAF